jgi:hypothetical protein
MASCLPLRLSTKRVPNANELAHSHRAFPDILSALLLAVKAKVPLQSIDFSVFIFAICL